jgi:hypothetical protein
VFESGQSCGAILLFMSSNIYSGELTVVSDSFIS